MFELTQNPEEATAATHGGNFHADDVLAAAILGMAEGNVKLLRCFKVPEGLNESVIVFDLGGGRYDHHQKGGNGCRENGVPYASAGLIWQYFGNKAIKRFDSSLNELQINAVLELIDERLIQGIDAVDNGVMPRTEYACQSMSVSELITSFNPTWDSEEDGNTAFLKAVEFAKEILKRSLKREISAVKAATIVEESIEDSEDHIMTLNIFVPWQDTVFASENPKAKEVEFIVFPSLRGGYNWQCVPAEPGSFTQRKPVPSEWKGLKGDLLKEATGVATATFCHPAGFIGGAETKEDAIKMARLAVKA